MAKRTPRGPQAAPPTSNPPRIVVQSGEAPPAPKAPTAAERMAEYARAYPERIPVLSPGDSVLVLHPLGFYVQHTYDGVVAVQRRALRDEAKAVIRAAMMAVVPADWQLPSATRFETDGARGLSAAPDSDSAPASEAPSLDDM